MRPVQLSFILYMGAIFSSIDGSIIEYIKKENCQTKCHACSKKLAESLECINSLKLTVCPYNKEHFFHRKCIVNSFIMRGSSFDSHMEYSHPECAHIMRRNLVISQIDEAAKSMLHKTLEFMAILSTKELFYMLGSMNLTFREHNFLVKNTARSQFEELGCIIKKYVADKHKYINAQRHRKMLKGINYGYSKAYNAELAKSFADKLTESQILGLLKKHLRMSCIKNNRFDEYGYTFGKALILSPQIQPLLSDDGRAIITNLLKSRLFFDMPHLLVRIKMEHVVDAKQIVKGLKWYFKICRSNDKYVYSYIWHCASCLCKLNSKELLQIKQSANKYFAIIPVRRHLKTKKWFRVLYIQLTKKPLEISEAVEKIRGLSNIHYTAFGLNLVLKGIVEDGIMRTIMCASYEDRMVLFQSMLDNWSINLVIDIYLLVPESNACAGMDVLVLRRLNNGSLRKYYAARCITAFTQRQYFEYEMLVEVLDVLFELGIDTFELECTRALLAADHRELFKELADEKAAALFEKFVRAKFFMGIALLDKLFKNREKCKSVIETSANDILLSCIELPPVLQEYVARKYANSRIFVMWSKNIASVITFLIEKQRSKELCMMQADVNFAGKIWGSKYFAENVEVAEIAKLTRILINQSSLTSLRCMSSFFTETSDKNHIIAAKIEIFKELIVLQPTGDDLAVMNAIGFKLKLINFELAYEMDDGSMAIIEPDNVSEKVVQMIKAVNEHRLLELLQNMLIR